MENTLTLFVYGLIVVSVLFSGGLMLSKVFKETSYFRNTVLAILVATTTYALLVSSFRSYLLILLVFFVYAFVKRKIFPSNGTLNETTPHTAWWKPWLLILSYFSFSFFVLNAQLLLEKGPYSSLHPDFSFYASVSEILAKTGIENRLIDTALEGEVSFSFYHYFELWFNALVSTLLDLTHLKVLMYVTIPAFASVMLLGVYELQQKLFGKYGLFKTNWKYLIPLSILFVFPFTISLRWMLSLGSNFTPWNPSIALNLPFKWIIVLSGFVFLFVDYKEKKLYNVLLIFGFISVVYPTTMVATLPSLLLWFLFFRKQLPRVVLWDVIVTTLTIGLVMWRVSTFNTPPVASEMIASPSTLSLIKEYFLEENKSRLLLLVKEPILRTLYVLVAFAPLLALLWFKKDALKKHIEAHYILVVLIGFIYLLSAGGIVLLEFSYNGDQLHRNIFYPLFVLLFQMVVLYLLVDGKRNVRIAGFTILLISMSLNISGILNKVSTQQPVETQNAEAIIKAMNTEDGKSMFIADTTYFHNTRRKNFYFVLPGYNLRFDVANYFPHCLSMDRINLETEGDWFNLGTVFNSGRCFKPIMIEKLAYSAVFREAEDVEFLIIDQNTPEFRDAEKEFNVEYLGKIGHFAYFKKSTYKFEMNNK